MFDFIADSKLRSSLESDLDELHRCFAAKSWKSVHVMAGSIIEALLVDHLRTLATIDDVELLRLPLGALVGKCAETGVLAEKTVDLASAIKEYRNLIHPGKQERTNDTVSHDTAIVVRSLVNMITGEIAAGRKETYGYTAEQLLSKFERDRSVQPILKHLIRETREQEVKRLIVQLVPERVIELSERAQSDEELAHLSACYRETLTLASPGVRKAAARGFVKALKEESGGVVRDLSAYLFRAMDLEFLDGDDRQIAKEHLMAILPDELKSGISIERFEGLGKYIEEGKVNDFVDPLARVVAGNDVGARHRARKLLEAEALVTPGNLDPVITKRLQQWADLMKSRGVTETEELFRGLAGTFELPF